MDYVRVTFTRTFLTFYHIGYIKFGKGYGATWKHMFLYAASMKMHTMYGTFANEEIKLRQSKVKRL